MNGTDWNQELLDKLKELRAQGLTNAQIGARLGKSKSAIQRKCYRLGWIDQKRSLKAKAEVKRQRLAKADKPPAPDSDGTVTLLDLQPDQCRYPYGDAGAFRFCGQPRRDGSSYCAKHHAICYTGGKLK